MANPKLIAGILLILFCACGQPPNGVNTKESNIQQELPSYIIFGIFCGECSSHCATMYRYNIIGNTNTLFVDSTDSYFKNDGIVVCRTEIRDIGKFQIVNKLVQQIPESFLKTGKAEQAFGCPDCSDGCGIYFELEKGPIVKKFRIDYDTRELGKDVRDFGELIKETLVQLNDKKQ